MKALQPEFPFISEVAVILAETYDQPVSPLEIERQAKRSACIRKMTAIVEAIAEARAVDWRAMFAKRRGTYQQSEARTLAMALCCALDVPQYIVARSFKRTWASVYCAERQCSRRYRKDAKFRREWDALVKQLTPKHDHGKR